LDSGALPGWEISEPFRVILSWWFETQDRLVVHGAAVAAGDGAVIVVGPSGSGKSTAARAALAYSQALPYIRDDLCLVGIESEPVVRSLYGVAKMDPDQARRIPELAAGILPGSREARDDDKAVIPVGRLYSSRIVHRARVRAIAVAQRGD